MQNPRHPGEIVSVGIYRALGPDRHEEGAQGSGCHAPGAVGLGEREGRCIGRDVPAPAPGVRNGPADGRSVTGCHGRPVGQTHGCRCSARKRRRKAPFTCGACRSSHESSTRQLRADLPGGHVFGGAMGLRSVFMAVLLALAVIAYAGEPSPPASSTSSACLTPTPMPPTATPNPNIISGISMPWCPCSTNTSSIVGPPRP